MRRRLFLQVGSDDEETAALYHDMADDLAASSGLVARHAEDSLLPARVQNALRLLLIDRDLRQYQFNLWTLRAGHLLGERARLLLR